MTTTPTPTTPPLAAPARASLRLPLFRRVIWLMPVAYLLHIVEEYTGDFPRWVDQVVHGRFSYLGFDLNNLVFLVVLCTLVTLNWRRTTPRRAFALTVFASANLFWDALFHLGTTAGLDRYSPGLITASVLYLPICLLVGTVILREGVLPVRRFVPAVALGALLFGFVLWYGLFHFAV
jgi:hypothetical protein